GRPAGEGLPVLIIAADGRAGRQVADKLAETQVHGVALVEQSDESLIVILTEGGAYGVAETVRDDAGPQKFTRRLRATAGWHAVIVAPPMFRPTDAIHGFFECVLLPAPEGTASARSRQRQPRAGRTRRR